MTDTAEATDRLAAELLELRAENTQLIKALWPLARQHLGPVTRTLHYQLAISGQEIILARRALGMET